MVLFRKNVVTSLILRSRNILRNYSNYDALCENTRISSKHSSESFPDSVDLDYIEKNIKKRKVDIDINKIKHLISQYEIKKSNDNKCTTLIKQLKKELLKIPNATHPDIFNYGDQPKRISLFNNLPKFDSKRSSFKDLTKKLNLLRTEHLGNLNGHKSYYLMSALAEMEHALINFALNKLEGSGFKLISVPDILPSEIIEGCGMQTTGERTQVYKLKKSRKCLSGTSEMALAGYFANELINENNLPLKLTSVSRCFRAETSGLQEEKGIFRVHQFTKVEMFSVCHPRDSNKLLEEFKNIEVDLFSELGLHFQLLDMPPSELGNSAYRKYDIEAWMPGRGMWGEISSCSNCTDYQAKRLNIKIEDENNSEIYAHTVNGTACAIPRMLITLLEHYQRENGDIDVPERLQSYLRGKKVIKREKLIPELKLIKSLKSLSSM